MKPQPWCSGEILVVCYIITAEWLLLSRSLPRSLGQGRSQGSSQNPKKSFSLRSHPHSDCISLQDSMSGAKEDNTSSYTQLSSQFFLDILDSVIADVASECHRIAKLGLDRNLDEAEEELRLSAQARAKVADPSNSVETNAKYVVDIFGQTHPPVASEVVNCMNCGRQIVAGRFAPHLEKCMGKGRKARLKATRSTTAAQNRYLRGSPNSSYSPYSNSVSRNRLPSGSPGIAGEDYSNGTFEENVKGG